MIDGNIAKRLINSEQPSETLVDTTPQDLKEEVRQFREAQKVDPNATTNPVGRPMYFGCYIPENYRISGNGIFLTEKKWNGGLHDYEEKERRISPLRIMVTGRYQNIDGEQSMVKITYIDKSRMETIYATQAAVLGIKEFKQELRPRNIRIDDHDIKDMIRFLHMCIEENENEGGSAFEYGFCFSECGWVDKECKAFKAGERLIVDKEGRAKSEKCIFTDVAVGDVFEPRGTWQEWVKGVKPLMGYPNVRFACYASFSPLLYRLLGVDSFTLDIFGGQKGATNDRSGSGKSTMGMMAVSQQGNVNPEHGLSLFNEATSTANFAENIMVKFNDLAVVFDESTKLNEEEREKLAYRTTAKGSKGRASDPFGGVQKTKAKHSMAITTGERPLVTSGNSVGTRVRVLPINGGVGASGIGEIVTICSETVNQNCGHLLFPFIDVIYRNRDKIKGVFEASRKRLIETTDSDMSKRMATKYAVIETAGVLLEPIYEKIGIEKTDASEIVNTLWQEGVIDSPIKPAWLEALEQTWEWYEVEHEKYFKDAKIYTGKSKLSGKDVDLQEDVNQEIHGWKGHYVEGKIKYSCLNIMTKSLKKLFKEYNQDYTSVVASWVERGVANGGEPNMGKGGKIGKSRLEASARRGKTTHRVVQLKLDAVIEKLGIEVDW